MTRAEATRTTKTKWRMAAKWEAKRSLGRDRKRMVLKVKKKAKREEKYQKRKKGDAKKRVWVDQKVTLARESVLAMIVVVVVVVEGGWAQDEGS